MSKIHMINRDSVECLQTWDTPIDLIVTDPPYAFSGYGAEHELTASVAIVLRESAKHLKRGSWMIVYSASSWRSISYIVESVRPILSPVRIASWIKPKSKTKVRTVGWNWSTVAIIAMRKGPKNRTRLDQFDDFDPDYISCNPLTTGRRAELPDKVALWSIKPFIIPNGVFLDPFAGSYKLTKIASKLGMIAYGIEKDPTRRDGDE